MQSQQRKTLFTEDRRKLLTEYLNRTSERTVNCADAISTRPAGEATPLSWAQEQVWKRAEAIGAGPALYNESITITRTGPLDLAVLQQCLTEIIRRHEVWRTHYQIAGGKPFQAIQPPPDRIPLQLIDLTILAPDERRSEADRLAGAEALRPFNLLTGPLVRATVFRLEPCIHKINFVMHQSVVDGVSVYQILPRELLALYAAYSRREASPLPELPVQYADYAYWQRRWLCGEVLESQVEYWRKQLDGAIPSLPWPNDFPRPAKQTFQGAIMPFRIERELAESLSLASRQQGCTLFAFLLAGFALVLHHYTGQDDILVGTVSPAGRKRPEVQNLLGYFLNLVALRLRLDRNLRFTELLSRARETIVGALSHDDVPLEQLIERLEFPSDPGRHPLFQVAISLAPPLAEMIPGWQQTFMDADSGGARWDLYLELSERPDGLLGRAQYNPGLFRIATLERLLTDFESVLASAVSDPGCRIAELSPR
jgi:surfactin family lipopeptide synthetase A